MQTTTTTSPWGLIDHRQTLGPDVELVGTPEHGGVQLGPKAQNAVPETVLAQFSNGPQWAEEDLEMTIALVFLMDAGHLPKTVPAVFKSTYDAFAKSALQIAEDFGYDAGIPALRRIVDALPAPSQPAGGQPTGDAATSAAGQ